MRGCARSCCIILVDIEQLAEQKRARISGLTIYIVMIFVSNYIFVADTENQ